MLRLSDDKLSGSIEREGVMSLYFILGNDEFLIESCVRRIVHRVFGDTAPDTVTVDLRKCEDAQLEEPFYSFSMLASKRVMLIDGFDSALDGERAKLLASLITDIPEYLHVIFRVFSDVDNRKMAVSKKQEEFFANVRSGAFVLALSKSGTQLESYIERLIAKSGCTAQSGVSRDIAELCGDDLMLISNEVQKLAALCDYSLITRTHVAQICIRTPETGVYEMLSALERNNIPRATEILEDMLDEKTEPVMISSVMNTAFINLYRARLVVADGGGEKKLFELFDYKKNDRKVSIAFGRCREYSVSALERIIGRLYLLDRELKSNGAEGRIVLERRFFEIASLMGRKR